MYHLLHQNNNGNTYKMTTLDKNKKYRFGINWGAETKEESQDIDLRVSFLNKDGEKALTDVYFGHHQVPGVNFINDDKIGDIGENDKIFNEGVIIELGRITTNVEDIHIKISKENGEIVLENLTHLEMIVRDIESDTVVFTKNLLNKEWVINPALILNRSNDWSV